MKYTILAAIALLIFNSCLTGSKNIGTSGKFSYEEWQKKFIDKIEKERKELNDSLWSANTAYKNAVIFVKWDRKERFLTRHDTALQKLGSIPVNASVYFVENTEEGEVSGLYYAMFWIKGNKYKGVWRDNYGKWHTMKTKPKHLRKFIEFRTELNHKELIYTGGGQIFITQFRGSEIIDVDFVAMLSLPQYLFTGKIFRSQKPSKIKAK